MSNTLQQQAEDLLHRSVAAFIRALQTVIAKPSAWGWWTSGGASVTAGTPALKFSVGATGGNIYLMRGGTGATSEEQWNSAKDRVHLPYGGVGVSVGVAVPQPWLVQVSPSFSAAAWWNTGALYIVGGSEDFKSPDDFNEPSVGFAPFLIIGIDGGLMGPLRKAGGAGMLLPHAQVFDRQIGGSAALMLIGVSQSLYHHLTHFFQMMSQLRELAGHAPPPGFLAGMVDSFKTQAQLDWDLTKMAADIAIIVARMQTNFFAARAALVSAGVEQVGWPGVGISVFGGILKGTKNVGTASGDGIFSGVAKVLPTPAGGGDQIKTPWGGDPWGP